MDKIDESAIVFDGEFPVTYMALPLIQHNYLETCRDVGFKAPGIYSNISCWPSAETFKKNTGKAQFRIVDDVLDYKPIQGVFDKVIEDGNQTIVGPFLCVRKDLEGELGNQFSVTLYKTNPVRDLPYTVIDLYQTVPGKLDQSRFKVGQRYWIFIREIN